MKSSDMPYYKFVCKIQLMSDLSPDFGIKNKFWNIDAVGKDPVFAGMNLISVEPTAGFIGTWKQIIAKISYGVLMKGFDHRKNIISVWRAVAVYDRSQAIVLADR